MQRRRPAGFSGSFFEITLLNCVYPRLAAEGGSLGVSESLKTGSLKLKGSPHDNTVILTSCWQPFGPA